MENEMQEIDDFNIVQVRMTKDDKNYFTDNEALHLYLMLKFKTTCRNQEELFALIRKEVEESFTKFGV